MLPRLENIIRQMIGLSDVFHLELSLLYPTSVNLKILESLAVLLEVIKALSDNQKRFW